MDLVKTKMYIIDVKRDNTYLDLLNWVAVAAKTNFLKIFSKNCHPYKLIHILFILPFYFEFWFQFFLAQYLHKQFFENSNSHHPCRLVIRRSKSKPTHLFFWFRANWLQRIINSSSSPSNFIMDFSLKLLSNSFPPHSLSILAEFLL